MSDNRCSMCGSYAINPHLHGRERDDREDLCDVCYWRSRAEFAEAHVRELAALTDSLQRQEAEDLEALGLLADVIDDPKREQIQAPVVAEGRVLVEKGALGLTVDQLHGFDGDVTQEQLEQFLAWQRQQRAQVERDLDEPDAMAVVRGAGFTEPEAPADPSQALFTAARPPVQVPDAEDTYVDPTMHDREDDDA